MLNIALFGPPGAGKGTQSEHLARKFNLLYVSTGDLLRKEIAAGSRLGEEARATIATGELVSDEIIVQIIEKTIAANTETSGILFDGFPRTAIQAYILEGLMIRLKTSLTCLIDLQIPAEVSVARLLERGKSSGRSDDNEKIIRNRLNEYEAKTLPVLEFYRDRGVRHSVDATRPVEEVKASIEEIVRAEQRKRQFNIVIFGYPGSGRGSQGRALARHFGLEYVSTGQILEDEIRNGTELGREIQSRFENGDLLPDEIVVPMLEKRLDNAGDARGFVFKGFPRTFVQSYILEGLLRRHGSSISKVIQIKVQTLEAIRRLNERGKTDSCRPFDTTTERIVNRLQDHEATVLPVIEKLSQIHEIAVVDGMASFDEVFKQLVEIIEPDIA